jgi:hypothetical protein
VVLVVRSPLSQSIELGERAQRTLARAPARFPFAVSLSGEAWPGLERTLSAAAGPGCAGSVAVEGLERSGAGWAVPPRTSVNGTLVVTLSEGSCTVSLEVTGDGARCAPASAVAEASVVPLDGLRRARAESLALSEKAALLEEAGRFESRRAAVARRNAAVGGLPGILLGLGAGGVLGALAALALLKSPPEAGGREGRSSAAAPPPRVAEARTKDEGHEGPAVPGGVDRDGQRA